MGPEGVGPEGVGPEGVGPEGVGPEGTSSVLEVVGPEGTRSVLEGGTGTTSVLGGPGDGGSPKIDGFDSVGFSPLGP